MRVRSIAAGAGTGKTTELTRVIRESIINGECRPHAIIGTTFTIKAAGELVERVRQEFFKSGQIILAERLAESLPQSAWNQTRTTTNALETFSVGKYVISQRLTLDPSGFAL